jgi:hypothetical protein
LTALVCGIIYYRWHRPRKALMATKAMFQEESAGFVVVVADNDGGSLNGFTTNGHHRPY